MMLHHIFDCSCVEHCTAALSALGHITPERATGPCLEALDA